mmetsp:Transcript_20871/g.47545  ORF Transcript_20871/g.47545 Transcript_20871/m.47545 type:complete len:172 (-) Transcript_20871:204-719(-)
MPMETFGLAAGLATGLPFGWTAGLAEGLALEPGPGELSRRPAGAPLGAAFAFGAGEEPRRTEAELEGRPGACDFAAAAIPAPAVANGDAFPPRLDVAPRPIRTPPPVVQPWQVITPDEVEKDAFPMALPQVAHTTHSGWKLPKAHFMLAPAMTSPHAVHLSPKCCKKQGVQ